MEDGDCFNIVEILSATKLDFLVGNNNDQVKIEVLRGKTICIYFAFCLDEREMAVCSMILAEVYNELRAEGEFEVVFVAAFEDECGSPEMKKQKIEGKKLFNNVLSKMPWLSIPFHDVETIKHLCNVFSMHPCNRLACVIINPNGKICWGFDWYFLRMYGAEAYPFTFERLQEIQASDEAFLENISLKTLLVSPTCDFVINNKFDEVPISELEGKVVGLFLNDGKHEEVMRNLLEAYEKLEKENKNFAVVLINIYFYSGCSDAGSFYSKLKEMPWFALLFNDERTRKVWRIFGCPGDDNSLDSCRGTLVILGPDGKLLETYSSKILNEYGSDGYPFTRQKVVEIEMKRIEQVTIETLFNEANQDSVIGRNGTEIPFSALKGKNIFIFCPNSDLDRCTRKEELMEWYAKAKKADETLEVIFIGTESYGQECYDDFISKMPWLLAFAFGADVRPVLQIVLGGTKLLKYDPYELVAFGSDGHIVSIEAFQHLQAHGVDACPFNRDNIAQEILDAVMSNLSSPEDFFF